jgi:hypothetical protein
MRSSPAHSAVWGRQLLLDFMNGEAIFSNRRLENHSPKQSLNGGA